MAEKEEKKEVEKKPGQKESSPQETPKKEAQKESPKEQAAKESAKEEVKEAAAVPEEKAKKRKKINRMKLEEIDKRLQDLETKGGGLSSLYAQHLLERKKELQVQKESPLG